MAEPIPDTLYAWVTNLPQGEGVNIIGVLLPGLGHTPLVFASELIARTAEAVARKHVDSHNQSVRLVRFESAGVLERFEP